MTNLFVLKSGDTMTGRLNIVVGTAFNYFVSASPNLVATNDSATSSVETAGTNASFVATRFSNPAGNAPNLTLIRSRGTPTASLPVNNGDTLGQVTYRSLITYGAPASAVINASIRGITTEAPTAAAAGAQISVYMCPIGSAVEAETLRINRATGLSYDGANVFLDQNRLFNLRGYTVATLPAAGVAGRRAYVTNALAPAYGAAVAGGGAVVIPVFDNGVAWITA